VEKHRNLDPGIKGSNPFFPVDFVVILTGALVIEVENRSR
jgi:hypothetical protein